MKTGVLNSGLGAKFALIAALLGLVSWIAFLIYGTIYTVYFDAAVVIFLLLGVIGYAGFLFLAHPAAEFLPLVSVVCSGIGMNLFFLNSYTVWADWYGNFNMYGSQGGITPVIAILVVTILSILFGIATCFTRKRKEAR